MPYPRKTSAEVLEEIDAQARVRAMWRTPKEIAQEEGCSVRTIQLYLAKALKRARKASHYEVSRGTSEGIVEPSVEGWLK